MKEFKQAHRRDDDIAIVNAGMRVQMAADANGAAPQNLIRTLAFIGKGNSLDQGPVCCS